MNERRPAPRGTMGRRTGVGRRWIALVLLPLLTGYLFAQGPEPETPRAALVEAEIARIAGEVSGEVGVAAIHLESRRLLAHNGSKRFPMASVYKIPIAVQLLTRAERGEIDLDTTYAVLRPEDSRPGSGDIAFLFHSPGVNLSLRNLLRLSLVVSDNTASDLALRAAGGPKAVTKRVRQLGIVDMRIDRSTLQLLLAWDGLEGTIADDTFSWETYEALVAEITKEEKRRAAAVASVDVRDSSTPIAMARLLEKIWAGNALEPASRDLLLKTMSECNGSNRIRGMLPPGLPRPPHKTGTMWGGGLATVNDAGIVELPDGAGHLAIAVFINRAEEEVYALEAVIAQITRLLVDFFILVPAE
ncbi:MAG: serine hydrolase [Candidatus Eisenbacteria bacterium]